MDDSLIKQFRQIISFASLAYTFTTLHTLQYYSMPDSNVDAQTTEDHDPTNFSASSSTHDTPASTENIEKASASNRWTDKEVSLLLDYVEANCVLKTAQGLTLRKSEFNKARATVKSKVANQCHYKWNHVRIVLSTNFFIIDHLL